MFSHFDSPFFAALPTHMWLCAVPVVCLCPPLCEFISICSKKGGASPVDSPHACLPAACMCSGKTPQNVIELNSIWSETSFLTAVRVRKGLTLRNLKQLKEQCYPFTREQGYHSTWGQGSPPDKPCQGYPFVREHRLHLSHNPTFAITFPPISNHCTSFFMPQLDYCVVCTSSS